MTLKTGKEYRYNNKVRVQKHREDMKAKGYIAKTIFLSNRFQDEINRICKEQRVAQHEALDLILDGYIKSQSDTDINVNDSVVQKIQNYNIKPISELLRFDDENEDINIPEIEISDDDAAESVKIFDQFLAIKNSDIEPENDS
ncbi:MAG: hypothetical protein HQK69_07855 [Desulfamplus sp.]|nr:hypothetical protein [Desulfamplus sp.]